MTRRKMTLTEKLDKARRRLLAERYNPHLVDDSVQTACLHGLLRGLDLDALPASWYLTTARRIAIDALRRDSRAVLLEPDKLDLLTNTRRQAGG